MDGSVARCLIRKFTLVIGEMTDVLIARCLACTDILTERFYGIVRSMTDHQRANFVELISELRGLPRAPGDLIVGIV